MENYEINSETLLIMPIEEKKSKVFELDDEFVINKTPLEIIKESCLFFGCSFEGRRDSVKNILDINMKVPIIIEDSKNIIFFPVSGCIKNDTTWISYQNLVKYSKKDKFSTVLFFRNNISFNVNLKYNLVDNQVIRCLKLNNLLIKRKKFLNQKNN